MDLVTRLAGDSDAAVLIVTHDITLCLEYADRVMVMLDGRTVDDVRASRLERTRLTRTPVLVACVPTLDSAELDLLPTLAGIRASDSWLENQ